MSRTGEEASTNFAKSVKGATDLKFGDRKFSSDKLFELQKRKPGASTTKEIVDGAFVVKALDRQQAANLTAVLEDPIKKEVFKAVYALCSNADENADADDDELISKMLTSLGNQTAIKLTIIKRTRVEDGKLVKAVIEGLSDE